MVKMTSANNVDGYESMLYFIGKGPIRLSAGKSNANISPNVIVLICELGRVDFRMENEALMKNRKKAKRIRAINNRKEETKVSCSITAMTIKKRNSGKKKKESAVMSANKLANRKSRGVIGDVKIRFCSYSNATNPFKVARSTIARKALIIAESASR